VQREIFIPGAKVPFDFPPWIAAKCGKGARRALPEGRIQRAVKPGYAQLCGTLASGNAPDENSAMCPQYSFGKPRHAATLITGQALVSRLCCPRGKS
jgi:hypothetical protein